MELEEKKAARFTFLAGLYKATEGHTLVSLNSWELGDHLNFDRQQTDLIVRFLCEESLLKYFGAGGTVVITHEGVKEVEAAMATPDEETTYFPPVNIINNYGSMTNSSIQQAGAGSTQNATVSVDSNDVQTFLALLRTHLGDLGVNQEEKEDLVHNIDTVEAQLKRSSPSESIIGECMRAVRAVMEKAVAAGLAAKAPELFALLPGILGM